MTEMNETTKKWNGVIHRSSFRRPLKFAVLLGALMFCSGCDLSHRYQRASVETPPAYKEMEGWKTAQPQDDTLRGKWWERFNDPQLNAREEKLKVSNQNIAAAAASFGSKHSPSLPAHSTADR